MATKPDDWMPLKIGAYLRDTTHLTRDQHGAYFLLLMAYWSRQGPLPADDRQLAAIVKATPAEWRRLKIIIAPFFQEREGRWFQKRADQELSAARKNMLVRSEAGKIGAESKWGSDLDRQNKATRSERLALARSIATHTKEEWLALVEIFGGACVRCGTTSDKPVKDHILPIYKGGSDGIENIQPLCKTCNSAKGPEEIDHRQNALPDWPERLAKRLANVCQMPAPITKNLLPDKNSSSLRSEGAERAADRLDEDPKAILFSEGHRWLVEVTGKSQAEARSIIGRMLRDMGGDAHASALLGIFRDTKRDQKSSPLDWILKIVSSQTKARAGPAADQAKLGIDKVTGKEWARTA